MLRRDLRRFSFLLGATTGEQVFGIDWSMTRACPGRIGVQRMRIVVSELNTGPTIVRARQRAAGSREKGLVPGACRVGVVVMAAAGSREPSPG